jgi:putative toxin-antitoxin system antitoxin component (TIGR02293 family)
MLIVKTIRSGIPYSLFAKIKNLSPFTDSDWASFLDISTKSLQRYKKDNTFVFKPIHSEKIIELAEVTNLGTTIFDTSEQFYSWLNTTSLALGNLKPIELLNNSYGKEIVLNELNRIEHGIFV